MTSTNAALLKLPVRMVRVTVRITMSVKETMSVVRITVRSTLDISTTRKMIAVQSKILVRLLIS